MGMFGKGCVLEEGPSRNYSFAVARQEEMREKKRRKQRRSCCLFLPFLTSRLLMKQQSLYRHGDEYRDSGGGAGDER